MFLTFASDPEESTVSLLPCADAHRNTSDGNPARLLAGCLSFGTMWVAGQSPAPSAATYVGSAACSRCHAPTFDRWKRTRMANVVRDPREHPEAIIADFTTPDPLLTFTKDQIAFVYGSKFKQRYFKKVGDDFTPFPATWDVTHRQWRPYGVTGATSGLCDGCHSVNYDIERKTVTEWNVGCERCHGPGSDHVARPSRDEHRQPGTALDGGCRGRLCPVPLGRPSRMRQSAAASFIGRWGSASAFTSPISGNWTITPSALRTRCTSPTAAPARIGCRATISFKA